LLDVEWSTRSLTDLAKIFAYISRFNPSAAAKLYGRLVRAADSLAEVPDRGRIRGRARELVVVPPYVVRYRVEAKRVVIVRIRHGARRPL
jgi:toxin ParE1/3/4